MSRFLFLALLLMSASAQGQGIVQVDLIVKNDAVKPVLTVLALKPVSGFSLSTFALVTEGWEEFLVGQTWSPNENLTLGFSAGVQRLDGAGFEPRYSPLIIWGPLTIIGEFDHNGVERLWWDVTVRHSLEEWLGLAIHSRRFVGAGPQVKLNYEGLRIFVSWMPWNPDLPREFNPGQGIISVGW